MEHDATQKDWWMSPDATPVSALPRRALLLAPLGIGALLGTGSWLLFDRLQRGDDQSLAPPSPLIGKQLPAFALPGQMPSPGFSSADVIAASRPVLLNFFASWCMPCAQEAPVLRALKQHGVPVWGIAYKDAPEATSEFLRNGGDPYTRVARDDQGMAGNVFGLSGVPESFMIDASGIVRWHWAGGLSEKVVHRLIEPLLQRRA
jgi:cytochrome c biogenesis protein CcmG, thiol:disulfide interchange protein DsbE